MVNKMRIEIYRNKKMCDKLAAMWDSLSEKSRDVIDTNYMWFNDYLFERTPEEVNRFLEDEWSDDDEE